MCVFEDKSIKVHVKWIKTKIKIIGKHIKNKSNEWADQIWRINYTIAANDKIWLKNKRELKHKLKQKRVTKKKTNQKDHLINP